MSADDLNRAVELLVRQVAHWTGPRWARPAPDGTTQGDLLHRLVQQIADDSATAAGEPHRVVPRLEHDLSLPDQLRVVSADLIAAGPPAEVLTRTAARVRAVQAAY